MKVHLEGGWLHRSQLWYTACGLLERNGDQLAMRVASDWITPCPNRCGRCLRSALSKRLLEKGLVKR